MGRSWWPYHVRNVAVFQPCERIDAAASLLVRHPGSDAIEQRASGDATTRVSFHRPRKRSHCCAQYRKLRLESAASVLCWRRI